MGRDGRSLTGASRRRTPTAEGVKRRIVRASGEDRMTGERNAGRGRNAKAAECLQRASVSTTRRASCSSEMRTAIWGGQTSAIAVFFVFLALPVNLGGPE